MLGCVAVLVVVVAAVVGAHGTLKGRLRVLMLLLLVTRFARRGLVLSLMHRTRLLLAGVVVVSHRLIRAAGAASRD